MPGKNIFIKRLFVVYNNLSGTNPLRLKNLLGIGLSVPTSYRVLMFLTKEKIAVEIEGGKYYVDWEKFKQYLDMLVE